MSRTVPHARTLLLITLVSLLVLVFLREPPSSKPLISQWRPPEMMTRADQPISGMAREVPAPQAPVSGLIDLRLDPGLYTADQPALQAELQAALQTVSQRFGSQPVAPIITVIRADPECGIHGLADTNQRTVYAFSCPQIPRRRAVNIMAHEFVHQLAHDRYGAAHLNADLILLEGVATWGAGGYWLGNYPTFRQFVHDQRQAGAILPLATDYRGLSVSAMNTLYYQWGSFVEFLIERYGRERFDQAYASGNSTPGSADYRGVYGKELTSLEQEWLSWLDQ